MDDDIPPAEKNYPLTASKMSKTPSWVMLGFLAGAAFVYFFRPPPAAAPAPAPVAVKALEPEPERAPGPLSRIEAMWEEWGKYAIWHDDTTEVGLWDPGLERIADYYEVRRLEGKFYFRTIPKPTGLVVTRYKIPDGCPLQFTETEEQYREWFDSIPPVQRMWKKPPPPPQSGKAEVAPPARVEVERPKVPVENTRPNIPGSK